MPDSPGTWNGNSVKMVEKANEHFIKLCTIGAY